MEHIANDFFTVVVVDFGVVVGVVGLVVVVFVVVDFVVVDFVVVDFVVVGFVVVVVEFHATILRTAKRMCPVSEIGKNSIRNE